MARPRAAFYPRLVRFLCISDIHGHADALAAVLATAERRGYDKLLVAGDLCFPGPSPLATFRRLTQAGAVCVQGAGDRALATLDVAGSGPRRRTRRPGSTAWARCGASSASSSSPASPACPRRCASRSTTGASSSSCTDRPRDPLEPLSHDMTDEEISALLGDDPADVVVCGGSHVPFDRVVSGVRVINVGSVGEAPRGHAPFLHADATLIEVKSLAGRRPARAHAVKVRSAGPARRRTPSPGAVRSSASPLGKAA